jgi:WD40 repeat protein
VFAVAFIALSLVDLPPGAVLRLGETRFRAGGEVRHLRFSSDGRTLTGWTTFPDGLHHAIAWDVATGLRVTVPPRSPPELPTGTTPSVLISGNRVLTAGPGNAGRVWDATTARQLAQLGGHVGRVTTVAGSPDGKRLATGSTDGLVRIWDGETFRPLSEPHGHTAKVRAIRVSQNGKRVVTIGEDGSTRVWDSTNGRELRAFANSGPVELTADGLGLVFASGQVRDVLTGMELVLGHTLPHPDLTLSDLLASRGLALAMSPDGRMVAVGHRDGSIGLYEWATGGLRRLFSGHGAHCTAMAFTPDGFGLLTAGGDHTVLVWDVRLRSMPLTATLRRETNAAKLWATMCTGKADAAYLAAARLAAEPPAALQTARLRLRPANGTEPETFAQRLADSRAVELLESLGTPEARNLIAELTTGEPTSWRTHVARRALERLTRHPGD